MKKISFVFVALVVLFLSSCGASWQRQLKTFTSEYGAGLERLIVIRNSFTNEIVDSFVANVDINGESTKGDVELFLIGKEGSFKVNVYGNMDVYVYEKGAEKYRVKIEE